MLQHIYDHFLNEHVPCNSRKEIVYVTDGGVQIRGD